MFYKESAIQQPTQTPVFAESIWVDAWPEETDTPSKNLYNGTYQNPAGINRITIARHGTSAPGSAPRNLSTGQKLPGAIVLGLADGHAEMAKLKNLWSYYWHRDYRPPLRAVGAPRWKPRVIRPCLDSQKNYQPRGVNHGKPPELAHPPTPPGQHHLWNQNIDSIGTAGYRTNVQ